MEIAISQNYWLYQFFRNTRERDLKIAEHLDEVAEEAENLARVWETVIESVQHLGSADADNNMNWLRLIERPEWTIYSTDIPKSKLELYLEHISSLFSKSRNGSDM